MHIPDWLVAHSTTPGRYFIVHLNQPRWFYVFDHVQMETRCQLQSQAFQSITPGVPSEQIHTTQLAEQAYEVFKQVATWFHPMPLCKASDYKSPPPEWLFGTSPDTFEDPSILLALRMYGWPQELAVLFFSEQGELKSVESSDDEFASQAREAFHAWHTQSRADGEQTVYVRCPVCRALVADTAVLCKMCGADLTICRCRRCRAEISGDSSPCPRCGYIDECDD